MNSRNRVFLAQGLKLSLLCLLAPIGVAFAQDEAGRSRGMIFGAMYLVVFLTMAVFYVYISLALQTIAKKTNAENGWLAWIPVANFILMLNIARKPIWWIILLLVPLVNLVILIIVWMAIAEARHKPSWWGILLIVPFANVVVPGYLAWSD
jgi:hypothetical protein